MDDGLAPTMIDVEYKFRLFCESERNQGHLQGLLHAFTHQWAHLLHSAIQVIVDPNVIF